jgi:hypothetical protein
MIGCWCCPGVLSKSAPEICHETLGMCQYASVYGQCQESATGVGLVGMKGKLTSVFPGPVEHAGAVLGCFRAVHMSHSPTRAVVWTLQPGAT